MLCVLWCLGWTLPAMAGGLDGSWELDRQASEDLTPLLEAQGVPWYRRSLAKKLQVTQHIETQDDGLHVTLETPAGSRSEHLRLDGIERAADWEGRAVQLSSEARADGSIVSRTRTETEQGAMTTVTVRRLDPSGDVLLQTLVLERPGQAEIEVTRVFRRTKAAL